MRLGETLRRARESKGLSIQALSEETRVDAAIIQGLEKNDFRNIAAAIYGQGYIRLCANRLGLDYRPLVEEFDALYKGDVPITPEPVVGNYKAQESLSRERAQTSRVYDPKTAQQEDPETIAHPMMPQEEPEIQVHIEINTEPAPIPEVAIPAAPMPQVAMPEPVIQTEPMTSPVAEEPRQPIVPQIPQMEEVPPPVPAPVQAPENMIETTLVLDAAAPTSSGETSLGDLFTPAPKEPETVESPKPAMPAPGMEPIIVTEPMPAAEAPVAAVPVEVAPAAVAATAPAPKPAPAPMPAPAPAPIPVVVPAAAPVVPASAPVVPVAVPPLEEDEGTLFGQAAKKPKVISVDEEDDMPRAMTGIYVPPAQRKAEQLAKQQAAAAAQTQREEGTLFSKGSSSEKPGKASKTIPVQSGKSVPKGPSFGARLGVWLKKAGVILGKASLWMGRKGLKGLKGLGRGLLAMLRGLGRGFMVLGRFALHNARSLAYVAVAVLIFVLGIWAVVSIQASLKNARTARVVTTQPVTAVPSDIFIESTLPPPTLYAQ